ncbi:MULTISPECIES: trigger factor [Marichromatium]|uniref:Trigger factor n=1 Tax=Marichromatium gracile TaxID=1048 RepID=A0A4R4A6S7_MARGR|nr:MULTISPECIES: trigger factor [Marichromatium]MBK1710343.1 trigger factor [Marichromatium gracile]RNE89170.1 trigger factor [Marichromatium sp. AB31]RNE93514.1 trigger factor [Marichromatium sp. AB32]TCW34507.1 trigger factor [Marichromatium gracile]
MQVSVESGEGLERRVKVELPSEQVTSAVDQRLQQLARSAKLPGFRPGKVPMKLVRKRYGAQVLEEVFGEQVQASFYEALTQESLRPAGQPEVEPEIDVEAGRFAYVATFEVMPEVELAALEGRALKRPVCELAETDLDALIERLRDQHKTWTPVERAAEQGDQLTISFAGTIDGEAFEGGSAADVELELGSGRMIPGFEDGLVGAAAGETRTVEVTFPEEYQVEALAGKPASFEITVSQVAEPTLPEVDGEFVKRFGIEDGDVERFKNDVRENMARELKQRLEARTKEAVMDLLMEANPVEVPQALVRDEIASMQEEMRRSVGAQGEVQLPDALFEEPARRRVALGLIIGELVKQNELKADQDRVQAMLDEMAATYENPQAVIDYYKAERGRMAALEAAVLESQVVDLVLGQVSVEDEETSFEALTNPGAAG